MSSQSEAVNDSVSRLKDPVCGMQVSQDSEYHTVYNDQTLHFCSEHCLHKFRENPDTYLTATAAEH